MLRVTKSRFYLVPVLMRTLDILELLVRRDVPLKNHEIADATGFSRSTTYRILRTLVHRGYLIQDLEGRFSIVDRPELKSASWQETSVNAQPGETDLSGEQVIEVLHGVLQTLRQRNEGGSDHELVGRRARQRQQI